MKPIVRTGLITGIISCIWLFGSFSLMVWLNTKNSWGLPASNIRGIGGLLSIPIQAIGIYVAMQNVKKLTGMLTYGQAIKTGLTVAITIAVVVALFSFVYCQFLNPGYAAFMVHDAQQTMIASGQPQQQVNENSARVATQFAAGAQVFMALVGQFVTGSIISLIIGLFIKSRKTA